MNAYASAVAMVRPAAFRFNFETAGTNHFQQPSSLSHSAIQEKVLLQFDTMVKQLEENDIPVLLLHDKFPPSLPDAIFPNNWFVSLKEELFLCPMLSPSRRSERRPEHIEALLRFTGAVRFTDWSTEENNNRFLEGTGSLVLDHENMKAFACRSERSNEKLFCQFCELFGFEGSMFSAVDRKGLPIYHTNVMMCLGKGFAVVCEEAITNIEERNSLKEFIEAGGRAIIEITFQQMENFAGNMLQLKNELGEYILVMSNSAYNSFSDEQIKRMELHTRLLKIEAGMIEKVGGGGVRCMMAELFPA